MQKSNKAKYPKVIRVIREQNSSRIYNSADFEVELPNGEKRTWSAIEGPDIVVILAIDDDHNIFMKEEFRLSQNKVIIELPSGRIEKGESPRKCAERELAEEVGVKAKRITLLGSFSLWNHCTVKAHIFLAQKLTIGQHNPDEGEILTVKKVPLVKALSSIRKKGSNAQTFLALLLAEEKIQDDTLV